MKNVHFFIYVDLLKRFTFYMLPSRRCYQKIDLLQIKFHRRRNSNGEHKTGNSFEWITLFFLLGGGGKCQLWWQKAFYLYAKGKQSINQKFFLTTKWHGMVMANNEQIPTKWAMKRHRKLFSEGTTEIKIKWISVTCAWLTLTCTETMCRHSQAVSHGKQ